MDKKIERLIKQESARQNKTIGLIPSENFMSQDILEILGSPLANKYSEGYPGRRYYPGNVYIDEIEKIAQESVIKAFNLKKEKWAANVQPYSGSPANLAVYMGLIRPGDTILGLELASGGHLTHGHKVSATGKIFNSIQYGLGKNGKMDYEAIATLAKKHKPKIIISGTTAYPRRIDFKKFGEIADSVGAYHVADISHIAGLVLTGNHPSPFKYSHVVTMTTHKTLRGPRGAVIILRKDPLISGEGMISTAIDKAVFPGLQGGPHNNQTAGIAQCFYESQSSSFKKYSDQIIKNAKALEAGLKAKEFKLVTGGTDTHLLLIDLKNFGISGKDAESLLEKNGIIANRNSVFGDTSPLNPSGLRLGTPAVTTRGMKEKDMAKIAELMYRAIVLKKNVKQEAENLALKYPTTKFTEWRK
jgi:glycine hydroxymethyltransferase